MLPEHAPFPSQVFTPDRPSPSQVPLLQTVSVTYSRQPPLPSQVPSGPHVAGVWGLQMDGSVGATPAGMKLQSPSAFGRLQALQLSPHADVQQTPSTQYPDRHSLLQVHDSLLPLLGGPASGEHAVLTGRSVTRESAWSLAPSPADVEAESLRPPSESEVSPEGDLHALISTAPRMRAATSKSWHVAIAKRRDSRCSTIKVDLANPQQQTRYSGNELGRWDGQVKPYSAQQAPSSPIGRILGKRGNRSHWLGIEANLVLGRAHAVLSSVVAAGSRACAARIRDLGVANLATDAYDAGAGAEACPPLHAVA